MWVCTVESWSNVLATTQQATLCWLLQVCWCMKGWSDGDATGCKSCNFSGSMPCSACGGGGTARPIPVKVQD